MTTPNDHSAITYTRRDKLRLRPDWMRALVLTCVLPAASACAEVTLPEVLSDGMVLQRGKSVPIWGTAGDDEKVSVAFRGGSREATASNGRFRVDIEPGDPGGPFELTVKGENKTVIKNVYVGDVWVISGQSNAVTASGTSPPEGAKEKIRMYKAGGGKGTRRWYTGGSFSKIGWTTGRAAYEKEKIPVGLIFSAVGGYGINNWMPLPDPNPKRKPRRKPKPGRFYGSLMRVQPFAVKGVVWWQGENDAGYFGGSRYEGNLKALVHGWRRDWGCGQIPFIWIQIQRVKLRKGPEDMYGAMWVRESQRRALSSPNTGMVVTFDVTDGSLHPKKERICERLAKAVKGMVYGEPGEWSGPLLDKAELKGDEITLSFTHVGEGLEARDGELKEIEIQQDGAPKYTGKLGQYLGGWARGLRQGFEAVKAQISEDGKHVIVLAKGLKPPLRVRYAWRAMPEGNLYNQSGLPASPFLTDPIGPAVEEAEKKKQQERP